MSITDYTYHPFSFQLYMKSLPVLARPNGYISLTKVDSKAEEYSIQTWNSAISSPSIGVGSIVDTRA